MRIRVGISFFTAMLLYQSLAPAAVVEYGTVLESYRKLPLLSSICLPFSAFLQSQ